MWQSHGFYYEPKLTRWEWQRARIFQTVEDLYTQSYVLPFLVPMLENAGANVLMPRERDSQIAEVVVDNDGCLHSRSVYTEKIGDKNWMQGTGEGFAHLRDQYINFENPFREGTFRTVETVKVRRRKKVLPNGFLNSRQPDSTPFMYPINHCQTVRMMPFTPFITKEESPNSK